MLKRKGKIVDDLIQKLTNWRHSGFSVYAGNRIARDDKVGQEALAQYIMRNAFAEEKISYIEDSGQVLYRSDMTYGKNKKNFELLPAGQFIAKVTQHISEKGFQMVRYYAGTQTGQKGSGARRGCRDLKTGCPEKRTAWISPYWTYLITSLRGYHPGPGGSLSIRSGRSIP